MPPLPHPILFRSILPQYLLTDEVLDFIVIERLITCFKYRVKLIRIYIFFNKYQIQMAPGGIKHAFHYELYCNLCSAMFSVLVVFLNISHLHALLPMDFGKMVSFHIYQIQRCVMELFVFCRSFANRRWKDKFSSNAVFNLIFSVCISFKSPRNFFLSLSVLALFYEIYPTSTAL